MPNLYDENIKLSHRLEGLINSLGAEISETLTGALDRVAGKILLLESKAEQTKSLIRKQRWLAQQKSELERILDSVYSDIGKTIKGKSIETATAAPEIADAIIKKVIPKRFGVRLGVPKLSKKRVLSWFESAQVEGLFFNDYLKKLETNTVSRIVRETRLALLSGGNKRQVAKTLQNALNTGRHGAMALADTSIRSAQVWAETQYHLENRSRLKGLRYQTELDRMVCPQCAPKDNQVYPVDSAPQPPLHMRCRCFLLPVFKNAELEKVLGEQTRIARLDTGKDTIRHRDSTTSTKYTKLRVKFPKRKLSYNDWMSSMVKSKNPADVSFAREALGKTRFQLVASGKLKMKSLYYAGKLRTIKELKELMK